jgi:hypothetical protein
MDYLPQNEKFILVDNNPPQYPHCSHKLASLGISKRRLVQVEAYRGGNRDNHLLSVLPNIMSLLLPR